MLNIEVKNPLYLIFLNWIILLIGNFGIPLIPMVVEIPSQQYFISFLVMNFNLFATSENLTLLITAWSVSIIFFGVFMKPDWKIPLYGVIAEVFVYLFAIILLQRHSPLTYDLVKIDFLKGIGVICGLICLLYIPVLIRYYIRKWNQESKSSKIEIEYISKCPHCGKEYQSNPVICFSCSNRIIQL